MNAQTNQNTQRDNFKNNIGPQKEWETEKLRMKAITAWAQDALRPPCLQKAVCGRAMGMPGHPGTPNKVHQVRVMQCHKPWQELTFRQGMGHQMVSLWWWRTHVYE